MVACGARRLWSLELEREPIREIGGQESSAGEQPYRGLQKSSQELSSAYRLAHTHPGLQKLISVGAFFGPGNQVFGHILLIRTQIAQPKTLFWDFDTFRTQWWCPFDLILITKFFAVICVFWFLSIFGHFFPLLVSTLQIADKPL